MQKFRFLVGRRTIIESTLKLSLIQALGCDILHFLSVLSRMSKRQIDFHVNLSLIDLQQMIEQPCPYFLFEQLSYES